MIKVSHSEILRYKRFGFAVDATAYSWGEMNELCKKGSIETLAYSMGPNGHNGCLFVDKSTEIFYIITTRSLSLLMVV